MLLRLNRPGKIAVGFLVVALTFLIFQHMNTIQDRLVDYAAQNMPDSVKDRLKSNDMGGLPQQEEAIIPPQLNELGLPEQDQAPDTEPSSTDDPTEQPAEQETEAAAADEDATPGPDTTETDEEGDASPKEHAWMGISGSSANFVDQAHKLERADDFLAHIRAVIAMDGVTMEEAKSGCNWTEDQQPNYQYTEDSEWVKEERNDTEIEERRSTWQKFMNTNLVPWEINKNRFEGRGIVIVAGERSKNHLKVILRQLRRLESQLPVELHFFQNEMKDETKNELSEIYPKLHFNDLSESSNMLPTHFNAFYNNYHLKTAGLINSRFKEVILLDSDNIPVQDPEKLFDTEVYKEYGTVFWPDVARTRPNNPMWAITNTVCKKDEYEQESGQMLVDKSKFYYHLQLAYWLSNDSKAAEYYQQFLLGDKDLFRFTWHALKTEYGRPKKWLASVGTVVDNPGEDEPFYCGHSFAQHHPDDGSVAFLHGGLMKTWDKTILEWKRENLGGIFKKYKRGEHDEDPTYLGHAWLKWDGLAFLGPNKPQDTITWCSDIKDTEPKDLEEIIPGGFEQVFEEIGGYWMLDG